MFGREARLPIDVCFGTAPNGVSHKECSAYVKNLRRSLENAYQRALDEAAKSAAANKQRYDMKVQSSEWHIGAHQECWLQRPA